MAGSLKQSSALDLSGAPSDVIAVLLGNMELEQRCTCALVCSDWSKAAAATTDNFDSVMFKLEQPTGLQKWLEKNGSHFKTMRLHMVCQADMPRLPCTQLRDLWLCGLEDKLTLEGRVWNDLAAASMLTSVSLQQVYTNSQQADVVSALTALPGLQQLTWREVQCGQGPNLLLDSRLLQQLTMVTSLKLTVSVGALQHLVSMSKLQRLCLTDTDVWDAAEIPGLQQLMALTSLKMKLHLEGLPSAVSNLTALQQLAMWAATPTELNCFEGPHCSDQAARSQLATRSRAIAAACFAQFGPCIRFLLWCRH